MKIWNFYLSFTATPNFNYVSFSTVYRIRLTVPTPTFNFLVSSFPICSLTPRWGLQKPRNFLSYQPRSSSLGDGQVEEEEEDPDDQVQDLRVPEHWLVPSKALEESEWLRVTLHKWLDDEYCPEVTNVEISNVAAHSYYKSLLEKETDLGVILLKMGKELESISYQESFHGAFSSANAAVNLIVQRIEQA